MKTLGWIAAAAGFVAAAYVLVNLPAPEHATGSDDVEGAARKTAAWGSKNRITGKGGNLLGKVKEGIGQATSNQDLADEGTADRVTGTIKDTVGEVAQAAGQTLHDLNR
jgi:uncharacterized protein YjbJ (UPF0337 family)